MAVEPVSKERTAPAPRAWDQWREVKFVTQFRAVGSHYTSHNIVVTRQIFGTALVDDIGAQVKRVLEVRRKHSVVDNDERLGVCLMSERREDRTAATESGLVVSTWRTMIPPWVERYLRRRLEPP
ncbi:hypothetical protein KCU99_g152, partial [Aureobasidium melanogenum]